MKVKVEESVFLTTERVVKEKSKVGLSVKEDHQVFQGGGRF